MPSNLHQLELAYNPMEDRLLLKIYTKDMSEFRWWLTRRFTQALWGILMKVIESDKKTELQHEQEQQKVSEVFEDEQSRKNPSAQKFGHRITKTPLGPEPLLAIRIEAVPHAEGAFVLKIEGKSGERIEIVANSYIIFSLCKLISETIKKTDWNLKLEYN